MKKKLLTTVLTSAFILTGFTTTYADEKPAQASVETMDVNKIQEEQRAELREIWDAHQVEIKKEQPKASITGIGGRGDILIALDSITDHVGIVKDTYTIIEAHPDNPGSDVSYRSNNWKSRYNDIKGMDVSTSYGNKVDAVQYAEAQLGEPYSLATTRWSTSSWYCSKLVWRAYYEQGVDLEGRKYEPRGTHVTPGDILDNRFTDVFYSS